MPNLTIASFRVEAYWRLVQLAGTRTQVTVHLRVRFLKFSMLKATITSQSTSQVRLVLHHSQHRNVALQSHKRMKHEGQPRQRVGAEGC